MLLDLVVTQFFGYFLVLARMIALAAFMPFISHKEISPRFRVMLAFAFSYMILPFVNLGPLSASISYPVMGLYIMKELLVGAFIGIVSKILLLILDTAGNVISGQIGLSSATSMNPNLQGSTLLASMLTMFGTVVFLSLDLHHLILRGFMHSYYLFPVGLDFATADMAKGFLQLFAQTFWWGVQLSFPFMIVFIVMQTVFGVMNRIIPQMQIFFVSLPFQLWAGLMVMLITGGAILMHFAAHFQDEFTRFLRM